MATFWELWLDFLLMNQLLRLELRRSRLSSEGRLLLAVEPLLVIRRLLLLLLEDHSLGSSRSIGLLQGLGLVLLLSRLGQRLAIITFLQLLGTWSGRRLFVLVLLLQRSRHELLLSLGLGTSCLVGLVANFLSGLLFGALARRLKVVYLPSCFRSLLRPCLRSLVGVGLLYHRSFLVLLIHLHSRNLPSSLIASAVALLRFIRGLFTFVRVSARAVRRGTFFFLVILRGLRALPLFSLLVVLALFIHHLLILLNFSLGLISVFDGFLIIDLVNLPLEV